MWNNKEKQVEVIHANLLLNEDDVLLLNDEDELIINDSKTTQPTTDWNNIQK